MKKVNLAQKLAVFSAHWEPKIIAELNGQHVKLCKFLGSFVWHRHDDADELFLVLSGSLDMQLRDRTITLGEGELLVVPRGTEHCPVAADEVHVLLFEPVGTVNTGSAEGDRTVDTPEVL